MPTSSDNTPPLLVPPAPTQAPTQAPPSAPLPAPVEELLPTLERGITEFNSGAFYACHDTLEAIWMEAETSEKPFYQGILQIAVAFYHLENLNWRGGAILMGEGINRLGRFEPSYRNVQVDNLVDQAVEWLHLVQTAGPEGLSALMSELPKPLPQVHMTQDPTSD